MQDERDMFYNSYGYAGGMPGAMMGIPMQGVNPGMAMNPNMMNQGMNVNPNMMNPSMGVNSNMMNQNPNMGMGSVTNNNIYSDIDNRISKMERQIKKLDQRVSRLEAPYSNNGVTNIYNEPDSNMYMI